MGSRKTAGLTRRGETWHIDKVFRGIRIRESTGTGDLTKAQEVLAHRVDAIRQARMFGVREDRTFRAAATKFLMENQQKRTIGDDASMLKRIDPYIGDLPLKDVHMGSLKEFIEKRQADGVKVRTINVDLSVVRRILNLASSEWIDERGMTWLERAPKIKLFPVRDARQPYPLSSEEQNLLFCKLPDHLARMALFKVNSGCREQEVCGLKWSDERKKPELDTSVFVVSGDKVKNGQDRLIVLNRVARSVIDSMRGLHPEYVFVRKDNDGTYLPLKGMNNTAWKNGRIRAADELAKRTGKPAPDGFRKVRVHDMKHTFGRRLRAAGVTLEDRQDLLGHKSHRITTHYSKAELGNLIAAAEKACEKEGAAESPKTPTTTRSSHNDDSVLRLTA